MLPSRARAWILLAWGWSALWTAAFAGLAVTARGPAWVAARAGDGNWADYWLLLLVLPHAVGPLLINAAWRRWVAPDAPPAPTGTRIGPWLVGGWLAPVAVAVLAAGVAHLAGFGALDLSGASIVARRALDPDAAAALQAQLDAAPTPYPVSVAFQALVVSLLMYTPVRMAEEAGWRGVLDRELAPMGPLRSAVVGALAWAVAQLPLVAVGFHVPGEGLRGALLAFAGCTALGGVLILVRRMAGTAWASAAYLGTLSGLAGFHELLLTPGSAATQSLLGASGALVHGALLTAWVARRGFPPALRDDDPSMLGRGAPPPATPPAAGAA
jgi:hypothetical protein